ncbi:MAG TPA: hypothetical protein VEC13_01080 [Candidatus Paceibacterota bacterium]|nr:hypothetical protein [Candidatus Paceibacterota bacterium]
MKKIIASKLKDVPEEQRNMIMKLVEENPELFQKIALEAQEKIKGGMDQMTAMQQTLMKYQSELKSAMGK